MDGDGAAAGTSTKSILKGSDPAEAPRGDGRRKKRDKSVGFKLEEGEVVAPKKTKTEGSASKKHESRTFRNTRMKKQKKHNMVKDNPVEEDMEPSPGTSSAPVPSRKLKRKAEKKTAAQHAETEMDATYDCEDGATGTKPPGGEKKQKRRRRQKKAAKKDAVKESTSEDELNAELEILQLGSDDIGETVPPEPRDFGSNRNILNPFFVPKVTLPEANGNQFTYRNALTNATVPASRNVLAPARMPTKRNVCAQPNLLTNTAGPSNNDQPSISNDFNLKKVVKWTKKRWNKDRKGAADESTLSSQVIVQNLPAVMSLVYRRKLTEVFQQFGNIKHIGAMEMQPSDGDDGEDKFTTTIYYENEEAAIKALEEDNTRFGGSVIRVRRPLPYTETTCVVRSYCNLPAQTEELCGIMASAGNIRGIRTIPRRGGGMALAFVEFDGPEEVERALALTETARINGKKVYFHKYTRIKQRKAE